jgi:hypothetical protein
MEVLPMIRRYAIKNPVAPCISITASRAYSVAGGSRGRVRRGLRRLRPAVSSEHTLAAT